LVIYPQRVQQVGSKPDVQRRGNGSLLRKRGAFDVAQSSAGLLPRD